MVVPEVLTGQCPANMTQGVNSSAVIPDELLDSLDQCQRGTPEGRAELPPNGDPKVHISRLTRVYCRGPFDSRLGSGNRKTPGAPCTELLGVSQCSRRRLLVERIINLQILHIPANTTL